MKKITTILLILVAVILTSCEGPMGPPGLPGENGYALVGTVFEIEGDFTPIDDYTLFFEFPNDFEIYDTDVVFVYILWQHIDGLDIWRLMPQTVVLPEGVIQYNYDYTVLDVQVFLEFTINENDLHEDETDGQVFRIAVLPADFMANKSFNENDYNSILNSPELKLNTIEGANFTIK